MAKILLIGDVHAVVEELDDCQRLVDYICKIAIEHQSKVCFMGDQYNTMSVIRSEVLNFWIQAFEKLVDNSIEVHALVGNHDFSGAGRFIHSMAAHDSVINVVDSSSQLAPGVLAIPHYDNPNLFLEIVKINPEYKTLLCHQTIQGAKYDNKFYAPDGVDISLIPQENIISGHIHTPQSFGKVTYIGSPRWRTLSDANIERAIWLYDFDNEGNILSKTPFSTGEICKQIKYLQDIPAQPIDINLDPKVDWRIDIKGPPDWIEKRKAELAGQNVKIRTFKTTGTKPVIKESDGISVAFRKYLEKYTPQHGTDKDYLSKLAKDRLNV